jgi:hypothetical protein
MESQNNPKLSAEPWFRKTLVTLRGLLHQRDPLGLTACKPFELMQEDKITVSDIAPGIPTNRVFTMGIGGGGSIRVYIHVHSRLKFGIARCAAIDTLVV